MPSENSEEVGALSNPTPNLLSEGEDNTSNGKKQINNEKNIQADVAETKTITSHMDGYSLEARKDTCDNSNIFAVKFDEHVSR